MKKWRNWSLVLTFFYGLVVALALNDYLKLQGQLEGVEKSPGKEKILTAYEDCRAEPWLKQAECLTKVNAGTQIAILPSYGHLLASKRTSDFINEQIENQARMIRSVASPSEQSAREYNLAMIDSGLAMVKASIAEYEAMQARKLPDSFSIHLSSTIENLSRRIAGEKFAQSLAESFETIEKHLGQGESTPLIAEEIPSRRDQLRELRDRFELAQAREKANLEGDALGGWLWRQARPMLADVGP